MSAQVIRVDWAAWAVREARAMVTCGPRAFVVKASERKVSPKKKPPRRLRVSKYLPGMAEWLDGKKKG